MQRHKENRRRNYFIDRSFQSKFIIKFCLIVIAASLVTGALTYYFNTGTTTVAFENLKVVVKSTADFILPTIFFIIIIVTVLVGIAAIIVTLFTSHKIAGPLYRLKAELEKMKSGNFSSPIYVRTGDQLQKIVSEFDGMRTGLKNSFSTLKENWDSLKADLQKLKGEIKDEEGKKSIENNIAKIDSELARFKTD